MALDRTPDMEGLTPAERAAIYKARARGAGIGAPPAGAEGAAAAAPAAPAAASATPAASAPAVSAAPAPAAAAAPAAAPAAPAASARRPRPHHRPSPRSPRCRPSCSTCRRCCPRQLAVAPRLRRDEGPVGAAARRRPPAARRGLRLPVLHHRGRLEGPPRAALPPLQLRLRRPAAGRHPARRAAARQSPRSPR